MSFFVARGKEEPNEFVLWEEYRDQAALNAHVETDHFKRLVIEERAGSLKKVSDISRFRSCEDDQW